MNNQLLLGVMAATALTFTAGIAGAADLTTTTTTTKTVKSVAVPGATVALPGASATVGAPATVTTDDGADVSDMPVDEDGSASTAGADDKAPAAIVTTTTVDKDTVTTSTDHKPVVDPATPGHKPGDKKASEKHAAKGGDESTDAGDKAAKAVTPLTPSSVPADPNVKVEQKDGVPVVH